jgi:mannitol operon transcriptional antiterminator
VISVTDRCFGIIIYLLKQNKKLTVKQIADNFNVSERTIRYDLDLIDSYLKENNVNLIRKSKLGVWIEDVTGAKEKLRDNLDLSKSYKNQIFSNDERKKIILYLLFKSNEPINIRDISEKTNVSRTTVINDINNVEEWLSEKGISLIRKPNYGIEISCSEISWRRAVSDYFCENFDKSSMLNLLNLTKLKDFKNSRIDTLMFNLIKEMFYEIDVNKLDKYIGFIEEELGIKFTDAAFAGIIFHISLSLSRLKQDKKVDMPCSQLNSLKKTKEYQIVQLLTDNLETDYKIKIPDSEIAYLTLHILGSKLSKDIPDSKGKENNKLREVIRVIVYKASILLGVDLTNDKELMNGLMMHIKPAVSRMKYGLSIYNPLLKQIKSSYSNLFNICKKLCEEFKENMDLTVNEDEIGYITIHIGAALERNKSNKIKKQMNVIVVCPTGIGTVNMLSSRIKQEFPGLIIREKVSLLELNEDLIKDVDAIISTVPIENSFTKPLLHVGPLLSNEDISLIKKLMYKSSKISYEEQMNIGITDLISERVVKVNVQVDNWEDAIREGGLLLLREGKIEKRYIDSMINICKTMNAYMVISPGLALAHASPEDGVKDTSLSLITLNQAINFGHSKNDPVKILITLAVNDRENYGQVINDLVCILAEKDNIKKMIDACSSDELIDLIKELLLINKDKL